MPEETREGFCKCGCGLRTSVPKYNDSSKGWVAGKPLEWISGHASRTRTKYIIDAVTGCWNWIGRLHNGYGRVFLGGLWYAAHVVTYTTKYGPVPKGLELDHKCRNRACCNPDHVEPVTRLENVRRGARTKLDSSKVHRIRELAAFGWSHRRIAKDIGVSSHHTVGDVIRGTRWGDV